MPRKSKKFIFGNEYWKNKFERNLAEWNSPDRVKEREKKKLMREDGGRIGECQIVEGGIIYPFFVCCGDPCLGPRMDCPRFIGGTFFKNDGKTFFGCIGKSPCNWGPEWWNTLEKNITIVNEWEKDDQSIGMIDSLKNKKARLVEVMLGEGDWPVLMRAVRDIPPFADMSGNVYMGKGDMKWLSVPVATVLQNCGAAEPVREAEDGQARS